MGFFECDRFIHSRFCILHFADTPPPFGVGLRGARGGKGYTFSLLPKRFLAPETAHDPDRPVFEPPPARHEALRHSERERAGADIRLSKWRAIMTNVAQVATALRVAIRLVLFCPPAVLLL